MRFAVCFLFLSTVASAQPITPYVIPKADAATVAAMEKIGDSILARLAIAEAKAEARAAALDARLTSLEARVADGERFASRMAGYKPIAHPVQAAPAVAAGIPPTDRGIPAPTVVEVYTPYPATIQTAPIATNVRQTVQYGVTEYRTGPLGLVRWRVSSGSGGCVGGR